jgi:hypothetical protein
MDGIWQQPDEPVLSGWNIVLLSGGAVIATDTTDANGMYEFDMVMPGQTYLVCEELQSGWTQTYPAIANGAPCPAGYGPYGYEITLQSGQEDTGNNFGNWYPLGCTLTQGYWKTHSEYGPAPEDEGWYEIGDVDGDGVSEGPNEDFFDSGQTWLETFQTNPRGGNAYYTLAHQYMAAMLNVANGASPMAINQTLADAAALLEAYSSARTIPRNSPDRALAIMLADILDDYNNGTLLGGPPHCDTGRVGGEPMGTTIGLPDWLLKPE